MAKFYTPTKLSENISETPEGFLLCMNVPIARTGWMEYGEGETPIEPGDDGKVHIYRSAEEVFRPETIASFEGKDITVTHPEDFVSPENWNALSKGAAQNVRRSKEPDEDGEESLLADLLIKESFTIKLVKAGLREVSCGYEAEYEQIEPGKGIQTNIVGNHIALVEHGRAGSTYAINDEKGKVIMGPNALERLKKKFGSSAVQRVIDEAAKEDKESKATDAEESMDELVKKVSDLGEVMEKVSSRLEGFMKQGELKGKDSGGFTKEDEKKVAGKDEDKDDDKDDDKGDKEESEDDEGEEMKIEERLKSVEAAVAKLLEKYGSEDEESEESEDEDEEGESEDDDDDEGMAKDKDNDEYEDEDESESEDADAEGEEGEQSQKKKTGDSIRVRAEILAPGLKVARKADLRSESLKAAYKTKDGKAIIDRLSTGKPNFKSNALFIAASEVLKAKRGTGLEKTKDAKAFDNVDYGNGNEVMTAEKMNELNEKYWKERK